MRAALLDASKLVFLNIDIRLFDIQTNLSSIDVRYNYLIRKRAALLYASKLVFLNIDIRLFDIQTNLSPIDVRYNYLIRKRAVLSLASRWFSLALPFPLWTSIVSLFLHSDTSICGYNHLISHVLIPLTPKKGVKQIVLVLQRCFPRALI